MNSQFQKPPTGAKGGRSSAGDPPYAADTKSRSQSAGARGKSDLGDFSRSGETGSVGKQPGGNSPSVGEFGAGSKPVGSPPVGSGDMTKPTVAPSFGSSDSKPDYSQSRDSSGISAASAHKLGSDYQSGSAGASKPRPTGTEALIDETHDTLGKAAETVYAASGAVHEATAQIADVAKEAFGATVSAVTAQAAALTSNITDELTQTAEAQKERGADAMHRLAKAIRTAAQELDDGSPEVARRVRAAAGSVDSLSSNLHGKSIGDLFTAASDFARNQPAAFFAGAVIAGFAFSRFLKSSSQPPAPPNGGHEATPPAASPSFGTGNISPSAPSTASF